MSATILTSFLKPIAKLWNLSSLLLLIISNSSSILLGTALEWSCASVKQMMSLFLEI